jgi:hypothetical protein
MHGFKLCRGGSRSFIERVGQQLRPQDCPSSQGQPLIQHNPHDMVYLPPVQSMPYSVVPTSCSPCDHLVAS